MEGWNNGKMGDGVRKYITPFLTCSVLFGMLYTVSNAEGIGKDLTGNEALVNKIAQAMDAFYHMDFQRSEDIFDEAIKEWPDDPLPYLFNGGFYLELFRYYKDNPEAKAQEYREKSLHFNNKAIDIADRRLEKDPDDLYALYHLGAGYGNIGRLYLIEHRWWNGFWSGKKGFKIMETVVNKDADYFDAYLGLGIYHYFSATLPKVVKVLSFLLGSAEGDKEKGIKELKLVRDHSRLLSIEARRILLRVFSWEGDWHGFYLESKWLVGYYPENLGFQISYLYALIKEKRFSEAKGRLEMIDAVIKKDRSGFPLSMHINYFQYSGLLCYHIGDYPRAIQSYLEAVKLADASHAAGRLGPEDYYYLASSYAGVMQENEAFQYMRQAIKMGWKIDNINETPEWGPYRSNPEFLKIIGK